MNTTPTASQLKQVVETFRLLKSLADTMDLDEDQAIYYADHATEKLTGIKPSDLVGYPERMATRYVYADESGIHIDWNAIKKYPKPF